MLLRLLRSFPKIGGGDSERQGNNGRETTRKKNGGSITGRARTQSRERQI